MNNETVTLDVREDIRHGCEPFSRIMKAVAALGAGQQLLLIAPFEPVPLFAILAKQGFGHTAHHLESGDCEVRFARISPQALKNANRMETETPSEISSKNAGSAPLSTAETVEEVDARGLEPPQPLVKILEALAKLVPGAELRARTDRRPMHLYSQLQERGFTAETLEQSDGSYLTHICRR